jgi:tRNA A-37 threonylcarbamoyl transferase component Bud32
LSVLFCLVLTHTHFLSTANDQCDAGGLCQGTSNCTCQDATNCDDNNPCTDDDCVSNACVFTPAPGRACNDGLHCNGADTCDASGSCAQHAGDPCSGGVACNNECDEQTDTCFNANGSPCDDALFCNGQETCDGAGVCSSPGDPCTGNPLCQNACSETNRSCNSPAGVPCDNGVFCDGQEQCDGLGKCVAGSPACPSADPCNSTCDETNQRCWAIGGTVCDDGLWCNGHDICSNGLCEHVREPCPALAQQLKNSCVNGCIEATHTCASPRDAPVRCYDVQNKTDCNDNLFCNGEEVCDGNGGVESKGNPCRGDCDAVQGVCAASTSDDETSTAAGSGALVVIIIVVLLAVCCIAICVLGAVLISRRKRGSDRSGFEDVNASVELTTNEGKSVYTAIDSSVDSPESVPASPGSRGSGDYMLTNNSLSPELQAMLDKTNISSANWAIPMDQIVVEKKVGEGSFGTVYAGVWRGGKVAIKTIQGDNFSQHELDEFLAEAEVMSKLRPHANVVQFFGVSFGAEGVCIITEFMSRGAVEDLLLDKDLAITQGEMLHWIRGIASGMQHLAAEAVVHRDLAARNVLLSENDVKIADFGMARELSAEGSSNTTKSKTGPLKHMAPESLLHRSYSSKSDVWAFAVTVAEILTRDEPFPDLDAVSAATQVTHGLRVTFPSNISPHLETLMLRCLEDSPEDRPDFAEIVSRLTTMSSVLDD